MFILHFAIDECS